MSTMEYNVKDRPRKVDTSKLTPEQADVLAKQINDKVVATSDKIAEELNSFLKIYGMKAKVQVLLEEIQPKGE